MGYYIHIEFEDEEQYLRFKEQTQLVITLKDELETKPEKVWLAETWNKK